MCMFGAFVGSGESMSMIRVRQATQVRNTDAGKAVLAFAALVLLGMSCQHDDHTSDSCLMIDYVRVINFVIIIVTCLFCVTTKKVEGRSKQ